MDRRSFAYTWCLAPTLWLAIAGTGGAGEPRPQPVTPPPPDYAAVLATEGHAGKVYELGGAPFTMAELAGELSRQTGKDVTYTDLPVEKYVEVLVGTGMPEPFAAVLADGDRGAAAGELEVAGDDLERLIGRKPTTLAEAIRAAL